MRRITATTIVCGLILFGCKGHRERQEIQDLRKSGELAQAREQCMTYLTAQPQLMELWPEFVQIAVALSKPAEREGENVLPDLYRAAVVVSAMNRHHKQNLPNEWRISARLLQGEMVRLLNREMTAMRREIQAVERFETMEMRIPTGGTITEEQMQSYREVNDAQRSARERLRRAIYLETLTGELSGSAGVSSVEQLMEARAEWMSALKLGDEFYQPIITSATQSLKELLKQATEDLQEVGYLIPATIFGSEVLQ